MQKRGTPTQFGETHHLLVSPKDLIQYLESEFACWMERWSLETSASRPEPDALTTVLDQLGQEREAQFLLELEKSGQEVYHLRHRGGFKATLGAMQAGYPMIYQAALETPQSQSTSPPLARWIGYADFLVRVEEPSNLGSWSYIPLECKLAVHPKPYFVIQACAYAELLAAIQGRFPAVFELVLGTQERRIYRTEDYIYYYYQLRDRFLEFVATFDPQRMPLPRGEHGCWQVIADQTLRDRDHLSLIANITQRQIQTLNRAGIATVTDLAQLPPTGKIAKLERTTSQRLIQQAQLQIASRTHPDVPQYRLLPPDPNHPRRGLALLPPASPLDIFFDMEGYPLANQGRGLEYLFGASYFDKTGELQFRDWWAHTPTQEKRAFEGFIDWVWDRWQRDPSLHVYHYAAYEAIALKRLMGRYGTREDEVDQLLRQGILIDLYQIVRQGLQVGEEAYSIKNLERFYWRKRGGEVKNAQTSVVQYFEWMQRRDGDTPANSLILQQIRDYNQDDCESTQALVQWLRILQHEAGLDYIPPDTLDSSTKSKGETTDTEALSPRQIARESAHQLATDILNQLDPLSQSASPPLSTPPSPPLPYRLSPSVQTLLAHLLNFHRREERPFWWRFFQLQAMDDVDLLDELEALAGLEKTAALPQKVKQSWQYEYQFDPAQETKLLPGKSYRVHGEVESLTLNLVELDRANGKAILSIGDRKLKTRRETEENWDLPTRLTLLNHNFVPSDYLAKAIADTVQTWHNSGQLQPALADFLERRSPRFHQGNHLQSFLDPVNPIDGMKTALANLNQSCLCIQGPPGSGKTYTAAKLILHLLNQGKTIAISANSHSVIANLLGRVAKSQTQTQTKLTPTGATPPSLTTTWQIAKVRSDSEDSIPGVTFTKEITESLPPTFQLVGATVYKLCRLEAIAQFDYLFVDEAGQVSLANLVAMARCAQNLVLIGDPMQLEQPIQGSHPGESGQSALGYFLKGRATIPPDLGLFLGTSYRMNPEICHFISEAIYDGRLDHAQETKFHQLLPATTKEPVGSPQPTTMDRPNRTEAHIKPAGLWFIPVTHEGNTQSSLEEVEVIESLVQRLLGTPYRSDRGQKTGQLTGLDILVVAPYNHQVNQLAERLGDRARCGTVDKFQGQEAPVAIVSMTASSIDDAARGMDFLLNRNRLNVAVSRAQCLAIVVGCPKLAQTTCTTLEQMVQLNLFCKLLNHQ